MARASRSRPSERKGGPGALAIAWTLALGVTAAAAGFVVLELTGETPRTGAGITIALPPAEAPEETPESAPPPAAHADAAAEAQPPVAGEAAAPEAAPTVTAAVAPAATPGPPRVAVVITGLGLSKAVSEQAVERLPPQVTLSFSPYSDALDQWIPRARAMGHEVMIDLPMEPASFPLDDPGPQALLTGMEPEDNLRRLRWFLDKGRGYSGVAMHMATGCDLRTLHEFIWSVRNGSFTEFLFTGQSGLPGAD